LLVASILIACGARAGGAQSTRKPRRIGYLAQTSEGNEVQRQMQTAFRAGLRDLGYVEGRDVVLDVRYAEGQFERLPALAAALVQANVDVIVSGGGNATRALHQATRTVPIVIATGGDPVAAGYARSLARPGGNITGVLNIAEAVGPKQVELLMAILPKLSRVALLVNAQPGNLPSVAKSMDAAARKANLAVLHVTATSAGELDKAFETMARERVGAVIVVLNALFNTNAERIAQLASKYRLPTVGPYRHYAEAGVLMSYGRDLFEGFRRAAYYVDRILKGAKPSDLPIEEPTKVELVVNVRTAKALGLAIPDSLRVRADRVIE
jgi:putative ABC transport system substrate-binding protein